MRIDINSDALVVHTAKLERMRKYDLPLAIRGTLNSAAFDMKTKTIPISAGRNFVQRKKTFFKSKSRVKTAQGFDIKTMESVVGFVGDDQAIDNLEQQESGGVIGGRSYIPQKPARISNSQKKAVRANARLSRIKNIVDPRKVGGANDKERFVKSVIHAGKGGHVLGEVRGKRVLWRVNSLKRTSDGKFKLTPLYSYKDGRTVNVRATRFMTEASDITKKKLDELYYQNAQRRYDKAMK